MRRAVILPMTAAILLAACSRGQEEPTGAVTADEARQLNEAAEMLDANSVDLNLLGNEQETE